MHLLLHLLPAAAHANFGLQRIAENTAGHDPVADHANNPEWLVAVDPQS